MTSDMAGIELIPLGVGDAFSARHYSTSLAVRHRGSGEWLLVDCPHPIHKILLEATATARVELPLTKLVGTLITHLHADHCSGLEGLGYYIRYRLHRPDEVLREDELPLLVAGPLVATMLAEEERERKVFQVRALEPGKALELGPFTVESRATTHGTMACYAFKISDRDTGRRISHSADTVLDAALIDWLADADFAVHEIGSPIPGTKNHTELVELRDYVATRLDANELMTRLHVAHYGDEFCAKTAGLQVLVQGERYSI